MNIMRIMRKSLFLFLLGVGIAHFSQGKNKQAVRGGRFKQTTLGCAQRGNFLQKLSGFWHYLFGKNIKQICWAFWHWFFFFQYSASIGFFIALILQTKNVEFCFSTESWIRKDDKRYLSFVFCLLVNKDMPLITLTFLLDAFLFLCVVYMYLLIYGKETKPYHRWHVCSDKC